MRVPKLLTIALLVLGAPVLAFPDILPAAGRTATVTALTLAAMALCVIVLNPWKPLRWGLWLFAGAAVISWLIMPAHDVLAVRHFAGVGMGLLAMAAVAAWCPTTERLSAAALLFSLGTLGILAVGLAGTAVYTGKSAQVELVPAPTDWLPQLKLGLPGLEKAGEVNANGLAGTALMTLPACGALVAAAWASRPRRRLVAAIGLAAVLLGCAVLLVTLSRTALIATALTLLVWGLHWKRGRPWIVLVVALLAASVVAAGYRWHATAPEAFNHGVATARHTMNVRLGIWGKALEHIRRSPWVGDGINQFHDVSPVTTGYFGMTHVAHAHNILLQTALDVGLPGLGGYIALFGVLLWMAHTTARGGGTAGQIAGGAGLSLVGVHAFGVADAIALGAKVGFLQWWCAGLILAAWRLRASAAAEAVDQPSV